jgi:type IV pilus assembly protein PilA
MLTRLRHRAHGQEGFTLIELLVVILIIGILAAVAIPAFLSQKGKGQDANVKSDINSAQTAEESYSTNSNSPGYVLANGTTPGTTDSALLSVEPTLKTAIEGSEGLAVAVTGTPPNAYTITAASPSGVHYTLAKSSNGVLSRTCDITGAQNAAGCNVTSGTTGSW